MQMIKYAAVFFVSWLIVGTITLAIQYRLDKPYKSTIGPPMVKCQEDEYVVGAGQYHNGLWTKYVCVHDSK